MRKKRKILAVAIASLFVLSMLAGCGPDSTQTQGDSGTLEGQLASAEPITMTIHMHYGNINVFDDNAPIYKEAAKADQCDAAWHGVRCGYGLQSGV